MADKEVLMGEQIYQIYALIPKVSEAEGVSEW